MVALDEFCANAVVVPTILPVILGRMVALAALALVGWCNLGGELYSRVHFVRIVIRVLVVWTYR